MESSTAKFTSDINIFGESVTNGEPTQKTMYKRLSPRTILIVAQHGRWRLKQVLVFIGLSRNEDRISLSGPTETTSTNTCFGIFAIDIIRPVQDTKFRNCYAVFINYQYGGLIRKYGY